MSELKTNSSTVKRFVLNTIVALGVIALLGAIAIPNFVGGYTSPINACINNLRQIDGAKQQWALEKQKGSNDVPTHAEVALYLKNNKFPVCPARGKYTLGRGGVDPTCSIPGHVLPTP